MKHNKKSLSIISFLFILVLPFYGTAQTGTTPSAPAAAAATKIIYGKYGCTASKYRNGSYEYIPRGSFTITKDGKYVYNGFEKPSTGTFTVDKDGNVLFKGGYLTNGKAEKIDRPNKFFLVFPTNPDNRWTCSLIEQK